MWDTTPCWNTSPSLRMSPSDECGMSSCRRCCCHAVYLLQRTRRIDQAYTLSNDASDPAAISSLGIGCVSGASLLERSCRCLLTAAASPAAEVALRLAKPRCQGLTGTQQDCAARMHMACAMAAQVSSVNCC